MTGVHAKYPEAYVAFLVEFHATRDYFECHEIMEEHWKSHPGDPFADAWIGLLQVAVALYHERRGNVEGARKLLTAALGRLRESDLDRLGLDGRDTIERVRRRLERLEAAKPDEAPAYADLDLPVRDPELKRLCTEKCAALGLVWGAPSDPAADALLHKHARRDRTAVVEARLAAWRLRQERRRENGASDG